LGKVFQELNHDLLVILGLFQTVHGICYKLFANETIAGTYKWLEITPFEKRFTVKFL